MKLYTDSKQEHVHYQKSPILLQGTQEKIKLVCSCTNISQKQRCSGGRCNVFGFIKPLSEAKLQLFGSGH